MYLGDLTLLKTQVSQLITHGNTSYKTVKLTVAGTFAEIGKYIEDLESMPTPLVIKSISQEPDSNNPGRIVAEISGGLYALQ
jgi:hypothetical protein